jgi:Xaa-Pro dipeptidase
MKIMGKVISRIEKLNDISQSKKLDAFIFCSASSVKYFSGYFFYFEYGVSPFHLLPSTLMVKPGQDTSLILADNEMGQSITVFSGIKVIPYESYAYEKQPDPTSNMLSGICSFIIKNKITRAKIGIEISGFPFVIAKSLKNSFPELECIDISPEIAGLKSVKDEDEIASIRKACVLADIGQEAVLKYAKVGMTELELFSLAHRDMENAAGFRIPLMADLSSGAGTNSGGGMPSNKKIEPDDLILSDFTPCLQGYWGDSCNTIAVGRPTEIQKETFKRVKEALEIGIQTVRPSVHASEVDRLMRAHVGLYPHHGGHGVGTLYHEAPRIVSYNQELLKPGMVIALEPAAYKETYGIRLEHLVLVTDTGSETLTRFQHQFEI